MSFDGMRWLPNFRAVRGVGILFFLINGCGVVFLVKSSSWLYIYTTYQRLIRYILLPRVRIFKSTFGIDDDGDRIPSQKAFHQFRLEG